MHVLLKFSYLDKKVYSITAPCYENAHGTSLVDFRGNSLYKFCRPLVEAVVWSEIQNQNPSSLSITTQQVAL